MTNSGDEVVVYMIQCSDGSLYTGWTTDIVRRVQQHNAGRGARYTASRRPVQLVFTEPQPDRRTAMRRELQIKRMRRQQKLKLAADAAKRS
jgi:putative endonuclease